MKQLKYLKLFEAFESIKLTKVLGYISKESRNTFINKLTGLARSYDFPMSNFSDDMFQYLPFKKALDIKLEPKSEPCKATSNSAFGRGYGVEGEKCEGGRIKRMWGSRQRVVECPRCGGTGLEPQNPELTIIKFWFTSDGRYVNVTGVDGKIRNKNEEYSRLLKGYTVRATLRADSDGINYLRSSAPHLTKVLFRANHRSNPILATLYKSGGDVFCIQNSHDGGSPGTSDWRTYGRYSWNITGGDFEEIKVLTPSKDDEEEKTTEKNPYEWNVSLSSRMTVDERSDVERQIKDAHFALILDLSKLKLRDFKTVSDISSERQELKSGSRLVLTDDEVRSANIKRYIEQIAKKADIVSDVTNIKNLVSRGIGGRWALFLLESKTRYNSKFHGISEYYYSLMTTEDEESKNYTIKEISRRIQMLYTESGETVPQITKNLDLIKKELDKEGVSDKYLPIVEGLERISQKFYNRVMSGQFETIEDLEIARQKMISLSNIFSNSLYGLDNLSNFIDYLYYENYKRSYGYLVGTWRVDDYYDKIIRGIGIVEKLVERL